MKIYDLSQEIYPGSPVYPGDPNVVYEKIFSLPEDVCSLTKITFGSHTGTHTDAFSHFIKEGRSISDIPLDYYIGKALVCHLKPDGNNGISAEDIKNALSELSGEKILLICTKYHGFDNIPLFPEDTSTLLNEHGITTVGIDSPSLEPSLVLHNTLLGSGIVIIEGLRNLEKLPQRVFFCGAPVKFKDCDGAPLRAVAIDL